LASALFPVGDLHKQEVRERAAACRPGHSRQKGQHRHLLYRRTPLPGVPEPLSAAQPGPIRTLDGELLGEHAGLMFHTIGQRQGLGIGGRRDGSGEPWYVASKDVEGNRLIVVQGHDHPALFHYRAARLATALDAGQPPPCRCAVRPRFAIASTIRLACVDALDVTARTVLYRAAARHHPRAVHRLLSQ
jgi:tRNA-specific 2-thiouridylase